MILSDSPFTTLSSFDYFLSSTYAELTTALNGASRLSCRLVINRHQNMHRGLRLPKTDPPLA